MTTTYPAGPPTPAGAYHLKAGRIPQVTYTSPDGSFIFNLMGGNAIYDRKTPECVQIKGLKVPIPPWTNIEQKGASQDGASYVLTLYDPLEIDLNVIVRGRDPQHLRQVLHDWVAAWDAKQEGQLAWTTTPQGSTTPQTWWVLVRWAKQPVDQLAATNVFRQELTWTAKCYDAFWRTDDNVASLGAGVASGTLARTNIGDQPMFDRYTCYGPGTFTFQDGPGSTEQITFGPLVDQQIVQLRTDPRKRSVVDLTIGNIPVDQATPMGQSLADYLTYATAGNFTALLQAIQSRFGIVPPQGNLYSLLKGRWSDNAAIPPDGNTHTVPVSIQGSGPNSNVIAAGTPLRRWPQ